MTILIRPMTDADFEGFWPIFEEIKSAGNSYIYPDSMTYEQAKTYWLSPTHFPFIAFMDDRIVGGYFLRPNLMGRGSHISNASFMVGSQFRGKGIGKQLGESALVEARKLGFKAMQFNNVVSTNTAAVTLWSKLGFKRIAVVPNGYHHKTLGYVDSYIMFRSLEE